MMFTAAMVALWLPPASAAPPRVLHDALVRAGPEAVVHRFESGSSARYFSVVRVGGAKNWPTRETFVFARRASPTHVGGNEHEEKEADDYGEHRTRSAVTGTSPRLHFRISSPHKPVRLAT